MKYIKYVVIIITLLTSCKNEMNSYTYEVKLDKVFKDNILYLNLSDTINNFLNQKKYETEEIPGFKQYFLLDDHFTLGSQDGKSKIDSFGFVFKPEFFSRISYKLPPVVKSVKINNFVIDNTMNFESLKKILNEKKIKYEIDEYMEEVTVHFNGYYLWIRYDSDNYNYPLDLEYYIQN